MNIVAYYRVSTGKQGRSGLGLESQKEIVAKFSAAKGGVIVHEETDVYSGKRSDRPGLTRAMAEAQARDATLVVATLDRLTRDAAFFLSVANSGVKFALCDLPDIDAGPVGRFILTMFAAVAELEAAMISRRTKNGLAAAKRRGKKLGGARPGVVPSALAIKKAVAARNAAANRKAAAIRPILEGMQDKTLRSIADQLNSLGYITAHRKSWSAKTVLDMKRRLGM